MKYLVTAKKIKDGKPAKQEIWEDEHDVLNFVRRIFVKFGSDETGADLQALSFMQKVNNDGAQVMRNEKNGYMLIFQKHTPKE